MVGLPEVEPVPPTPPRIKLRINSEDGQLLLELGAHVVAEHPKFAAKIGELAAEWAHAEAEMGALLAALMDTAPERTFALLEPYNRSAKRASQAALALAEATLREPALAEVRAIISRFNALATSRDSVQHGLWARKSGGNDRLFRLKALGYTQFMVRFFQLAKPEEQIRLATDFAGTLDEGYTVEQLGLISDGIRQVGADIFTMRLNWLRTGALRGLLKPLGFAGKI